MNASQYLDRTSARRPHFAPEARLATPAQIADLNLATHRVGQLRPSLSAEQREAAIQRAQAGFLKHDAIWLATGCMAARGDADRFRMYRDQLIEGRA